MRTYQEIVQQPGKVEDCHAERGQAVWGGVGLQEELVSVNRRGLAYNPEYRQCQDQCGQDPVSYTHLDVYKRQMHCRHILPRTVVMHVFITESVVRS